MGYTERLASFLHKIDSAGKCGKDPNRIHHEHDGLGAGVSSVSTTSSFLDLTLMHSVVFIWAVDSTVMTYWNYVVSIRDSIFTLCHSVLGSD